MGRTRENRATKDFFRILEQVHVILMFSRGLRLTLAATLGVALVTAIPSAAGASTQQATQTTLLVDTRDVNGRTLANVSVGVSGSDGLPATGAITLADAGKPFSGFALNAQGQTTQTIELAPGSHSFTAVYMGDPSHLSSKSEVTPVTAAAGTTPGFTVSVSPSAVSLKQGQSASSVVSVTPINAASLTAPMFVTISCSGLPDQSNCTFTPENIEIPVGATSAITSTMVIATQSGSLTTAKPVILRDAHPVAWAILPGGLILAGLAFGMRRRRFLSRFALLSLIALVTMLGATACSPLYNYNNHGPIPNLPTPAGTYTVKVAAQTSNGVGATTQFASIALTVTTK